MNKYKYLYFVQENCAENLWQDLTYSADEKKSKEYLLSYRLSQTVGQYRVIKRRVLKEPDN